MEKPNNISIAHNHSLQVPNYAWINELSNNSSVNPHNYSSYKKRITKINKIFPGMIDITDGPESIKRYLIKITRIILTIDIICSILDMIILIWTYFNHFSYNVQDYSLTVSDNIQRLVCLGMSFIIIILLIVRVFVSKRKTIYKYALHLQIAIPKKRIKINWLIVEIFIHCLQLYPFVSYTFVLSGSRVIYSLDMLFFFLGIFRVYAIFKLLFSWNAYFNGRAKRIFNLFNIHSLYSSIYRVGLKYHSYFTLFTIFIFLLFASSYIFKVFENWHPNESDSEFGSLLTCLWYILITMLNIGFGDYVPVTVLGRLVSLFVCFAGLFLKSVLTATLFIFAILIDDGEQKAYNQINLLYSKNHKGSLNNFYRTSYIKNKFQRLKSEKYQLENIIKWQKLNQLRDRYYLRVLSNSKIPLTIKDFCDSVNKKWDSFAKDSIYNTKEINRVVEEFNDFCIQSLEDTQGKMLKCMSNSCQLANLSYMIIHVGGLYFIDQYELIKGFQVVKKKDFEVKCREFEMKFYDKAPLTLMMKKKKKKNFPFRKKNDGSEGEESQEGSEEEVGTNSQENEESNPYSDSSLFSGDEDMISNSDKNDDNSNDNNEQ